MHLLTKRSYEAEIGLELHLQIYHFSGTAETGALPSLFQWVNPKGFSSPVLRLCWMDTPKVALHLSLVAPGQSCGCNHSTHTAPTASDTPQTNQELSLGQPPHLPPHPTTAPDKCKLVFIQGLKPLCTLQKETPTIDYKENWDRQCIRMVRGGRSNALLLAFCRVENFDGSQEPCSASPNKQTGQRRFFHLEEERVPYSGHSAAAKVEEWALHDRTAVVVDEAMGCSHGTRRCMSLQGMPVHIFHGQLLL